MSCAVMKMRQAARNPLASNVPSSRRNFMRLIDARLHAESSRNMYSEHGFEELIGAVFGQVCQRWIVSSYCMPGSPQSHVPSAILSIISPALWVVAGRPVVTERVVQSPPDSTARRNSSEARTERFAFWNRTDE